MSALTLVRRELKNARMYFVPSGTVLPLGNGSSSLTVDVAAVFPDNSPTTNYTDYEFINIEDVKESTTVKKETFTIPDQAGGYRDEDEEMVTQRMWKATTHSTNAYLKQLQNGLASIPVVGIAQAPGVKKDNCLDGVFLLEIQNKAGVVVERTQVWARLRLTAPGDVGPTTAKIEFSLEQLNSVYNSYMVVA